MILEKKIVATRIFLICDVKYVKNLEHKTLTKICFIQFLRIMQAMSIINGDPLLEIICSVLSSRI